MPPRASPLAVSKSKSRHHTRVGTIIAVSKPICIQSLFLSLAPVITSRQQSLLYQPPCRNHSVSYQLAHHHRHPIIYYINTHLSFDSTHFEVQDSFLYQHQSQDTSCLADTDLFLRTMDHHHQDTFCIIAFNREGGDQHHYYHPIQNRGTQGQ